MHYEWKWGIFLEESPFGTLYIETLIEGLKVTLLITAIAWIMALLIGTLVGTLRTTDNKWAVRLSNAYIELFRNIPLLVQMFIWYYVIPDMVPEGLGNWLKSLPSLGIAIISLGFFTSARIAIQVSTGIAALPRGQRMAGSALGFTQWQTYRYVLLPMAFRIIIPTLVNEFTAIVKNSSVALTITVMELTAAAYSMREFTFATFEALTGATVIYIMIAVVALPLASLLERLVAVPGYISTGNSKSGGH